LAVAAYLTFAAEDGEAGETVRGWLEAGLSGIAGGQAQTATLSEATMQSIGAARSVVLLLSPAAQASEAVQKEVLYALGNGRQVIPVLLGDLTGGGWMGLLLEGGAGIDARRGLDQNALQGLLDAVASANDAGRVIAMLNIKGGVGKTVLAANLFAAAHMLNDRSICFIDLDPQSNLTQYFLSTTERNRLRDSNKTLYSVFATRGEATIAKEDFVNLAAPLNRPQNPRRPKLDLIAGDERLFEFTLDLGSQRDREEAFARFHALVAVLRRRYQAVVIDTNPCATFLTRCAVTAADHIVAPVRADKYSLAGLNLLEWVTRTIRQRAVRPGEFTVLLNAVGERTRLGEDSDAMTRDQIAGAPFFGQALLPVAIPFSTLLRSSPADRYAANPINTTAIMRFAQRSLKETLTDAAAAIFARADALNAVEAPKPEPVPPPEHAPVVPQDA
jgi:cellulose biosynthesis protein BcsQ